MKTTISLYAGSRFAMVRNPASVTMPPSVLLHKLRGAADPSEQANLAGDLYGAIRDELGSDFAVSTVLETNAEGDSPEIALLWAILAQTLEDLYLVTRKFIPRDGVSDLRTARQHINLAPLWYCKFLGLDPDYVRYQIRKAGFMPEVAFREAHRNRSTRWNLVEKVKAARASWEASHVPTHSGSKTEIEFLLNQYATEA